MPYTNPIQSATDFYNYFNAYGISVYPTADDLIADVNSRISSSNLPSDLKTRIQNNFETSNVAHNWHLPDLESAYKNFMFDSYAGVSAAYLKGIKDVPYDVMRNYNVQEFGTIKIGNYLAGEYANSTNYLYKEVTTTQIGGLAKTIGHTAMGVSMGIALAKVVADDAPLDEAGKQALSMGAGLLATDLVTTGLIGLGIAAPYAAFTAIGIGALVALAAEFTWDNAGDLQNYTAGELIDLAIANFNNFMDTDGSAAANLLGGAASDFAADFSGAMLDLGNYFGFTDNPSEFLGDLGGLFQGAFNYAAGLLSPLTLDLDGDGVELISLAASTANFDLDANGFAERTGWVAADDGLLARDVNANGIIDNGTELFGDDTTDGFTKLRLLDSNADGVINVSDSAFASLRVWQDVNGDGFSQTTELKTLAALNIASIGLSTRQHAVC